MSNYNIKEELINEMTDKKAKYFDFFKHIKEMHEKAFDYFVSLPKHQWIKFTDIPFDYFEAIFEIINCSHNIMVDRDYNEFLICNKNQFPDEL
jgi:hypothetical protein